MVPVCDKRYHIYNRFRHFGAEIRKLWNYPLSLHMLGEQISTEGPLHKIIYCSVQFVPHASHRKDQPEITTEQ